MATPQWIVDKIGEPPERPPNTRTQARRDWNEANGGMQSAQAQGKRRAWKAWINKKHELLANAASTGQFKNLEEAGFINEKEKGATNFGFYTEEWFAEQRAAHAKHFARRNPNLTHGGYTFNPNDSSDPSTWSWHNSQTGEEVPYDQVVNEAGAYNGASAPGAPGTQGGVTAGDNLSLSELFSNLAAQRIFGQMGLGPLGGVFQGGLDPGPLPDVQQFGGGGVRFSPRFGEGGFGVGGGGRIDTTNFFRPVPGGGPRPQLTDYLGQQNPIDIAMPADPVTGFRPDGAMNQPPPTSTELLRPPGGRGIRDRPNQRAVGILGKHSTGLYAGLPAR